MDKKYKIVKGIFNPKKLDTLKTRLIPFIGNQYEFQYAWVIEEGDYKGQYAMTLVDGINGFYCWVPEEDVDIVGGETNDG